MDCSYPLLIDKCFKYVFSDKSILRDFLKSFFELLGNDINLNISEVQVQSLISGGHITIKDFYGDIVIKIGKKLIICLEVFNGFERKDFRKSLMYTLRYYSNQLKVRMKYYKTKKVIGIILFYDSTYKMDSLMKDYALADKFNISDIDDLEIEIFLIKLDNTTKFTYNKSEEPKGIKYLKAIKSENLEEIKKITKGDHMLEKLYYRTLAFIGKPKNRGLIDHFESTMRNAKRIAKLEGAEENKIETARKMLLKGMDLELTAELTGLSEDEISKLKIN